jgi:rhodanese-related sulfurtransferase
MSEPLSISVGELHALLNAQPQPTIVDVRTVAEYTQVHAAGAINLPLPDLSSEKLAAIVGSNPARPLYIICQSGGRSYKACEQAILLGFDQVVNVSGGTSAWMKQGYATISG